MGDDLAMPSSFLYIPEHIVVGRNTSGGAWVARPTQVGEFDGPAFGPRPIKTQVAANVASVCGCIGMHHCCFNYIQSYPNIMQVFIVP